MSQFFCTKKEKNDFEKYQYSERFGESHNV